MAGVRQGELGEAQRGVTGWNGPSGGGADRRRWRGGRRKNRVKVERERSDRTLRRFFGANRRGAEGRRRRRESIEITRSDMTAAGVPSENSAAVYSRRQNNWTPELIRIRTSSSAWVNACSMSK